MHNVVEYRAEYCGITSGYLGETRTIVASYRTIAEAEKHAEERHCWLSKAYEPGDYRCVVEGVKSSDLYVQCAASSIPVKSFCGEIPSYLGCDINY